MDHWEQLGGLSLVVESLAYGRVDPGPGFGRAHSSRLVGLTGAGHEGLGEDITLFIGDSPPQPELAGRWTLGEFCAHLDRVDQWPDGPPQWDMPPSVSPTGRGPSRSWHAAGASGARASRSSARCCGGGEAEGGAAGR